MSKTSPNMKCWQWHLGRVVIITAEQQLTDCTCSPESVDAAVHVPTVICLVKADQNHACLATCDNSAYFVSGWRGWNAEVQAVSWNQWTGTVSDCWVHFILCSSVCSSTRHSCIFHELVHSQSLQPIFDVFLYSDCWASWLLYYVFLKASYLQCQRLYLFCVYEDKDSVSKFALKLNHRLLFSFVT